MLCLYFDIGVTPGFKQRLHRLANFIFVERLASFLHQQLRQRLGVERHYALYFHPTYPHALKAVQRGQVHGRRSSIARVVLGQGDSPRGSAFRGLVWPTISRRVLRRGGDCP